MRSPSISPFTPYLIMPSTSSLPTSIESPPPAFCFVGKRPCVERAYVVNSPPELGRARKRMKTERGETQTGGLDALHDDIILSILAMFSSSATAPADLLKVSMTCKRLKKMATDPQILSRLKMPAIAVKAEGWSDGGAHKYLTMCANAGNIEACYMLGMIYFYCLEKRSAGANLMAKAALAAHPSALLSLAIIHFNGSGGRREDKNLKAGVSLCARSACLGNIDAMRELGHCLQDGYGVPKNVMGGRRLLMEANARESVAPCCLRAFLESSVQFTKGNNAKATALEAATTTDTTTATTTTIATSSASTVLFKPPQVTPIRRFLERKGGRCCEASPLQSVGVMHPANQFLVHWFSSLHTLPAGLKICSNETCGRPESRHHEFRRCSACGTVNYCSRTCQSVHWRDRHKHCCIPAHYYFQAVHPNVNYNGDANDNDNDNDNEDDVLEDDDNEDEDEEEANRES